MSESIHSTPEGDGASTDVLPRAVIHKKILDEAQASPDAPINAIATAVSGASATLVERVLEDYGDPSEADHDTTMTDQSAVTRPVSTTERTNGQGQAKEEPDGSVPDLDTLTDKQRKTLRAIYDHPEATQVELAEKLDVTNATICNRVNNIDGFDWNSRRDFVNDVFDNGDLLSDGDGIRRDARSAPSRSLVERVDTVAERVETLEGQLGERRASSHLSRVDPDLAAKIIHACMHSDRISDEEELDIVKTVIGSTGSER